ncbi:PspA/IM30 family protein [Microbacterium sp. APC 3898]|uniref:PspA/IM30 family protein n=2 Tax=Planococcus TaxID=1372 RepID=A0ABT7ZKR7_9BACL|nr:MULTISPECIES: PspA/IM30 family protein [Terrabacteria group]MBF6633986.1 PspA/IM30 family protein [Planococcus sp. (in: firmicutes)]MBD8013184.1 PspA/IM30 family protein [Planococcus wigleyi]MDN3427759.1 PspA/IM30 family protein [Planococcus sp. APC 4016]MDN3437113.1 PspA/IM30 family protein [Planococcus sp. APC 3900]MDN3499311.1 PspA/IM30 family protein [Microbacterium sp. APC 3898]
MTTLWERFKFAVATDLDAVVAKKEEKNPLALLNRYITEAENQTTATGKWVERQSQLNGKLEKELAEASAMLDKRQNQLELAQASGESDLADFAAMEVQAYSDRVKTLQQNLDENIAELTGLEHRYEEMKHKVKDMKVKQLQLMGKENATRAHHQMDKVLSPELVAERIGSFDDMASYITTLGAKVEERHERSAMERRLESLEKNSANHKEIV